MLTQRSDNEIIALILQSAEKGATTTTLMYETYLPQSSISGYLVGLIQRGFIVYLKGEMKFKTTPKGFDHLSSLNEIMIRTCSHQCAKCGIIYDCSKANCKNPFQN